VLYVNTSYGKISTVECAYIHKFKVRIWLYKHPMNHEEMAIQLDFLLQTGYTIWFSIANWSTHPPYGPLWHPNHLGLIVTWWSLREITFFSNQCVLPEGNLWYNLAICHLKNKSWFQCSIFQCKVQPFGRGCPKTRGLAWADSQSSMSYFGSVPHRWVFPIIKYKVNVLMFGSWGVGVRGFLGGVLNSGRDLMPWSRHSIL